jgi:hypothetical protein
MATSEDIHLATREDFFMATDNPDDGGLNERRSPSSALAPIGLSAGNRRDTDRLGNLMMVNYRLADYAPVTPVTTARKPLYPGRYRDPELPTARVRCT